ncbi:MAG: amidase, partial [Acidimicrobiaceae bacterium]|nr:amidase [Acidimicrobiaceae bacterium]
RLWLDKVARNFLPFNVTGNPALVVPVGLDEGRPAAVQIVAPHHRDARCLQVGEALQTATQSHTH